jgi:hypothetical protein
VVELTETISLQCPKLFRARASTKILMELLLRCKSKFILSIELVFVKTLEFGFELKYELQLLTIK